MNVSDDDRAAIVAWATRHPMIRAVYLYGSRARRTHRPDSDIDLAICMFSGAETSPYSTWFFWHEQWLVRPDLHLSHRIHLEWYEPGTDSDRVNPGVERDGVLLFERPEPA